MSEIYKINRVINNETSHIYVFAGDRDITEADYSVIFSAKELRNIQDKNIPIQIINAFIHGDDTIQRIKEKIFKECRNINNSTPNSMYLFSVTEKKLNSYNTFYNLTQQESIDLTDIRLKQFLSNIVSNKDSIHYKRFSSFFDDMVKKDKYEFNDFDQLVIDWESNIILTESIGQKLVIKNNYPFIANPFNNDTIDDLLQRTAENIISTQNAYLLFKYFPIKNNTIYLCLADDVLDYAVSQELSQEYFLKLYYPILSKSIKTKAQLNDEKMTLYNTEKTKVNKYYKQLNDRVDIFYKVFEQNPEPLNFTNHGISYIHITIHPENSIKLPLEVLFKIIHSNTHIPLIKYNPGSNYENIYRLFTDDNISVSGIKVPSLFVLNGNRKSKIVNVSDILSRRQSVGFYIEHNFKRTIIEIYCEFYENGSIEIKFNSEILLDVSDIEKIIKDSINKTILKSIRNYLKQSGYEYITFNHLIDKDIQINNLTYQATLKNNKKINLKKYIGCISALFNVIEGTATKTTDVIDLMYKRVNVFQVMDSIKAFITIRRQNDDTLVEIINSLLENFPKEINTEQKAREIFAEWLQEIQLKIDTYGDKRRIIDSNPGFKTNITSKVFSEGTFSVFTIENINDIRYLKYILIYINSFFRIILKKGINEETTTEINRICKKPVKQQAELDQVKDIQADTEKRGAVKFGEKEAKLLDIEEDTDEDELEIDEDTDEEEEEEEEEDDEGGDDDSIEFGDDSDEELSLGDEQSKTKKTTPKDETSPVEGEPVSVDSDLSLIDDDDDEDDSISVGDSPLGGGGKNDSDSEDDEMEEDLSNLAITGAKSIFTKRLKDNDPALFLKKDTPGYASYTRSCPNQYRRQPVLISDEEKKYIDERDAELGISSYGESIRYGSGDKKNNYICPRFWCIRDKNGKGRSLTLEQVNRGECGGWDAVIPEKAKKVPKGKKIVEFTDERFHRENSKISKDDPARKIVYRPMYPGFQDPAKHPDGLCIPCCFQTPFKEGSNMGWETDKPIPNMFKKVGSEIPNVPMNEDGTINLEELKQKKYDKFRQIKPKKAKLLCNEDVEGQKEQKETRKAREFEDTPIMSFPLRKNQFGYMNLSLQKFLGFDNSICYTKKTSSNSDKRLKQQKYCIVRLGIEKNKYQSFLELLASVVNYYSGMKTLPGPEQNDLNLNEFKQLFLDNLTIDKFVMAQNGILPRLFHKDEIDVDLRTYRESKYFQEISNDEYKRDIARSFENFKNYIMSSDEYIDYRYIWDFVTKPINKGGLLFDKGINLLILKNPNNDITEKIELICPTNHYSNDFFNIERKTLMVYAKGVYFEPLCKIYKKNKKFQTIKFFSFPRDYSVFKEESNILDIISKIKDILERNCIAKKSLKKYDYERNISSINLIKILKELDYNILAQIINYDNKVIGILTYKERNQLYVPCRPSSITFDLEFRFFQEIDLQTYEDTKRGLTTLYNESNKRIPCDIKQKLIDDNMIVGIKTITNQIIPVIPIPKIDDDIEEEITYSGENALQMDDRLLIEKSIDNEREKIVKALELENNFYSLFRNTLKILLNYESHNDTREELLNIVESRTITYIEKLDRVVNILHSLLDNVVNFIEFRIDDLSDYEEMISCLGLNNNDCTEQKHCTFMRKNTCVLTLPSRNLYSNSDNNGIYFNKLADEIIRYSKIRNYLFTPREFLSFEHVNYKINDNEIILLEEILFDTYLDDIKLRQDNRYIESTNIYDIINPVNRIKYSSKLNENVFKSESESKDFESSIDCMRKKNQWKLTPKMRKNLSNNNTPFQIEQYEYENICGFQLIQFVLFNYTGKNIGISEIKTKLIEEYLKLDMPENNLELNKMNVSTWKVFSYVNWLNHNKLAAEEVISKPETKKNDEITLQIQNESYAPTEVDLFLILKAYNIPSIIKMKGIEKTMLNVNVSIFNTFDEDNEQIYIILVGKKLKSATRSFAILKMNDIYKIPKGIINKKLLSGVRNMNKFIQDSLIFQETKKAKKREQDKVAQQNVRKKKGKITLSSKN